MITRAVLAQGRRRCRLTCSSTLSIPSICFDSECSATTHVHHRPWSMNKRFFSPIVINPEQPLCENQDMAPYIRTCLSATMQEGTADSNSGFHVWFLGTGGSMPSKYRMTSATMLHLGGQSYLFDAGEGIQRQLMYTRGQRLSDLTKIFITHMHADHVLGLTGLLLRAQLAGRDRGVTHVIEIYGPPGIYNYIVATLVMTRAGVSDLKIVVYELVGGDADEESRRQLRGKQTIRHGHLPDVFKNKSVARKQIERNDDGTWTIQRTTSSREDDYDVDRGGNRPMNITAAEVTHLETIQTFGYVVSEPEPSQRIDVDKATELGVAPGRKYRNLKNGFSVMSDDGIREVKPEQVLKGANRKVRKFAYIGDNCGLSPAMEELCMNTDVLVHEAVKSVENAEDARRKGHSSAAMAGEVAKRVDAQVLALNHISAGGATDALTERVLQAEEANGGVSRVVPSFDFMELMVPRFGFRADIDAATVDEPEHHSGPGLWRRWMDSLYN